MAIQDMIKKRQRSHDSIELSSSEATEPSKPPKDALALGRYLVNELELKDRGDTLGRWMAHHVAELIEEAENASTAAKRLKARKDATKTILEILMLLDRLRPTNDPFQNFINQHSTKRDKLATDLFGSLSRITIALLLMKIPVDKYREFDSVAVEALDGKEQHILLAIQQWKDLFVPITKKTEREWKSKQKGITKDVDLSTVTLKLVDKLMDSLVQLKSEIEKQS